MYFHALTEAKSLTVSVLAISSFASWKLRYPSRFSLSGEEKSLGTRQFSFEKILLILVSLTNCPALFLSDSGSAVEATSGFNLVLLRGSDLDARELLLVVRVLLGLGFVAVLISRAEVTLVVLREDREDRED